MTAVPSAIHGYAVLTARKSWLTTAVWLLRLAIVHIVASVFGGASIDINIIGAKPPAQPTAADRRLQAAFVPLYGLTARLNLALGGCALRSPRCQWKSTVRNRLPLQPIRILGLCSSFALVGALIVIGIMPRYMAAGIMFNGRLLGNRVPPPMGPEHVLQTYGFLAAGGIALGLVLVVLRCSVGASALYIAMNPLGLIGGGILLMVPVQHLGMRGICNSLAFFSLPALQWSVCVSMFVALQRTRWLQR